MLNKFFTVILSHILVLYSVAVSAASLQVSPISLKFQQTETAKEIWLTNTSEQAIRAQTRVLEWTQDDNKDVLNPTRQVVASPAVTEIPAGGRQLIRVIKTSQLDPRQEQSYRLIIDELPSAKKTEDQAGLQLLLQYSVPVFFESKQDISAKNNITSLTQIQFSYNNHKLTAENNANSHIRLSQLSYINPNGEKTPLVNGLLGYALAHKTMTWDIPAQKNMLPNGKFEARINTDAQTQILIIK